MYKLIIALVVISTAFGFMPTRMMKAGRQLSMANNDLSSQISKALGVAVMGVALAGPVAPALADGAVSASTVFRARTSYGAKIYDLNAAASKGDFSAFNDKKAKNAFDLFISGSNAQKSDVSKARKASELEIQKEIFAAVDAKDAGKLKAAFDKFVEVADLKPAFKPDEKGQTDSSGYSPTWGTSRQYIYQR